MSFARFSATSDVYVYQPVSDPTGIECCGCHLAMIDGGGSTCPVLHGVEEVARHMWLHEQASDLVPAGLLDRVERHYAGDEDAGFGDGRPSAST